ncbi:MAG: N-acetylmuramoyl-L-alanine amidase [Pseudomonadota bacterium]
MTFKPDSTCARDVRAAVNFGERAADLKTDIILLHYTGMETAQAALDWLCCEESGVSCHYFVFEDGRISQLVPEIKRAWHAGKSSWQDVTDINSRSIGIEIANPGHNFGYPDFPEVQIEAVIELCRDVIDRHDIPQRQVLAHSDVAPGRKPDPGEKFPWQTLFDHGVGHWVPIQKARTAGFLQLGDNGEPVAGLQALLALYGYGVPISGSYDQITYDCIEAFQRHFRQSRIDGIADGETLSTLDALVQNLVT